MKKIEIFLIAFLVLVLAATFLAPANSQTFDFNETSYEISLYDNGSASWSIEHRVLLESEEEVEDFESYMENFSEKKDEKILFFINDTKQIVDQAEHETNRKMSVKGFEVDVEIIKSISGQNIGLLTYSFYWKNFSCVSDGLRAGDVFVGGLTLGKSDMISISYPKNYSVESVEPTADERTLNKLIWFGPKDFAPSNPSIVLVKETSKDKKSIFNQPIFLLTLSVISIMIIAFFFYKRQKKYEVDEEIRDDEKIILDLLRKKEGGMYQSKIVEQTNFSKAKVSNLLKKLKEKK